MNYQMIGTEFIEQQVSNVLDEWTRLSLVMFYWPYFVAGNLDNWKDLSLGFTKNFNICKPY